MPDPAEVLQANAPTARLRDNRHNSPRLADHRSVDLENLPDYHDQSLLFLSCAHVNCAQNRAVYRGSETVTRTPTQNLFFTGERNYITQSMVDTKKFGIKGLLFSQG